MESPTRHREDLRSLYPSFTDAELDEADSSLEQYLEAALLIWERMHNGPSTETQLLTPVGRDASITAERSN